MSIKSVQGFTFIEVLLSLFIVGIVGVFTGYFYIDSLEKKTDVLVFNDLDAFHKELQFYLNHHESFQQILQKNNSLRCLDTFSCKSQNYPLIIYNKNGDEFYNSSNLKQGINLQGVVCQEFQADSTDTQCPLRAHISWKTSCLASHCDKPIVEFYIKFQTNKAKAVSRIHWDRLNFKYTYSLNQFFTSAQFLCKNIDGQLVTKEKCALPFYTQCDPGFIFNGLKDGKPLCSPFQVAKKQPCPYGHAVQGIQVNGEIFCAEAKKIVTTPIPKYIKYEEHEKFFLNIQTSTPLTGSRNVKVDNFRYDGKESGYIFFRGSASEYTERVSFGRGGIFRGKKIGATFLVVETVIKVPESEAKRDSLGVLKKDVRFDRVSCRAFDSRSSQNLGRCL